MAAAPGLRAVLLDAAGTLLRLREPVGATYARFAAAQGVELPDWRLEDAFARVLRAAEPMHFPAAAADEVVAFEREWWRARVRSTFLAADSTVRFPDFEALFDALFRHYAGAEAWEAAPGARTALRELRGRGLATGVASNFDHRLHGVLQAIGIVGFLDCIVTPASCRARKPDARFFEAACDALGVAPGETLYVGDDPEIDAEAARRAALHGLALADLEDGLAGLPAYVEALATLGRRPPRRAGGATGGVPDHE